MYIQYCKTSKTHTHTYSHDAKKHYSPGNHHASHLKKCPISRSQPPANHQYWWPNTSIIVQAPASEGSSVPVVSRWLWPVNRTFLEVASMVVTWWIVAFLRSECVLFWYICLLTWQLFHCCASCFYFCAARKAHLRFHKTAIHHREHCYNKCRLVFSCVTEWVRLTIKSRLISSRQHKAIGHNRHSTRHA